MVQFKRGSLIDVRSLARQKPGLDIQLVDQYYEYQKRGAVIFIRDGLARLKVSSQQIKI